jgi:hypothetical protein
MIDLLNKQFFLATASLHSFSCWLLINPKLETSKDKSGKTMKSQHYENQKGNTKASGMKAEVKSECIVPERVYEMAVKLSFAKCVKSQTF